MHLTYYLQKDDQSYEAFYTYKEGSIDANEIYARQLCEYFIVNGSQYRLLSNEMDGNEEMLIVEHLGAASALPGEVFYNNEGIRLEFREYLSPSHMPLLYTLQINPYGRGHWEVIRYLLKDYIDVPTIGICKRDSAELDEDRRCYVLYVTRTV